MEKKVLLKDLVSTGTHIRTDVTPKAVISDNGEHQIAEFWDANKTIDVIVNNSHKQHDNIRELDEYTHAEESRAKAAEANLNRIKVGRITVEDVKTLTENQINSLSTGDVVIKSKDGKSHAYTVTYKKANEMCLVYADHENIEEVYYEKQQDVWTYVQTDNVPLKFKTISGQSIIGEGNIDIPSIPTNVSSFTNDAGYLTSHQSLSNYYTKSEVEGLIAAAIASLTPSEQESSEPSEPGQE